MEAMWPVETTLSTDTTTQVIITQDLTLYNADRCNRISQRY